jgi:O-antigen/teichoic acid export membrane protein
MAQIPFILEFLIRSPLIIALAILGHGLVPLALSYVVGIGALLLLVFHFMREMPGGKPSPELRQSYVRFAVPMAVISFTTAFTLYLDKVMISVLSGSDGDTQLGLYFGAQRIVMFIITSAASLAILLFPTISRYHARGQLERIKSMMQDAERYLAMAVFPCIALLAALSAPVIAIFGKDYTSSVAGWTLAYLAIFGLLNVLNRPFSQVITGTGRPGLAVKISVGILFINFLLNLLLIPGWDFMPGEVMGYGRVSGAVGAAIATCMAAATRFVVVRRESRKIVGYRMRYGPMVKFLSAATVAGAAAYLLHNHLFMIDHPVILVPEIIIGLVLYIVLLVIMREFTREDLGFFMDLLHPGKMKDYIQDEIKGKDTGEES